MGSVALSDFGLQSCRKPIAPPGSTISALHRKAALRRSSPPWRGQSQICFGAMRLAGTRRSPGFSIRRLHAPAPIPVHEHRIADGLRRPKERARQFRSRHPGAHHGNRRNLASRLHHARHLSIRRTLVHRGTFRRTGPQGILPSAVLDGSGVSPLSAGAHRRGPDRRSIPDAGQSRQGLCKTIASQWGHLK